MKILTLVAAVVFGIAAHGQQRMTPEQAEKVIARLRGWAETYYPAIASAKQLPVDNLILGFLVDSQGAVLRHSVGFKSPSIASSQGVSVLDELGRLFPDAIVERAPHGGMCFGGDRAGEPRYCVYYAEQKKDR